MGSVRTSILRRPRRLSPHRRADHGEVRSYTLDWEEPDNPLAENVFKVIFLGFTVLGSVASLGSVIDFSDSMIFMMSIPNLIGLYLLRNVIRREFSHYRARLASGEIKEFADRH